MVLDETEERSLKWLKKLKKDGRIGPKQEQRIKYLEKEQSKPDKYKVEVPKTKSFKPKKAKPGLRSRIADLFVDIKTKQMEKKTYEAKKKALYQKAYREQELVETYKRAKKDAKSGGGGFWGTLGKVADHAAKTTQNNDFGSTKGIIYPRWDDPLGPRQKTVKKKKVKRIKKRKTRYVMVDINDIRGYVR